MILKTTLLKTLLLVFALCIGTSYLSAQTLTAHYKFDNTLNDETGNWDLSPSSGFTPIFETGQDGTPNGAVSGFDDADFLETASDFSILGNTSRSMTAWVKVNTIGGSRGIVGAGIPSGGERWSFLIDGQGRPRIEIQGQGFNNGSDDVEEDTWFHVAVVWDASVNTDGATGGESIKLYLNGQLGETRTWLDTDVMTAASKLRIGNDFNTNPPGRGFSGALDDIQIYEGALTDDQILDIYNGDPICVTPTNLIASNIEATSVDISWDEIDAATEGYEYFVTSDGTVPDSSTTPTGSVGSSTFSTTLSGLDEGTNYSIYVRSSCNGTDVSEYSSPLNITTPLSAPTLVAHYKFDNTLNDETGDWDLSPSSGFTPTFETGQDGTANGAVSGFTDIDFLETATDFGISGNTSRSMTAWVKVNAIGGSRAIVGAGFPSNGERWSFLIDGNGRPRIEIAGQGFNNDPDAVVEDTWFHVAVVWDASVNTGGATGGESIKLYLNGELGNTNTWLDSDVMTAASKLRIGNDFNTNPPTDPPSRGFSGALDEVQIYEGALTDAEVLDIYEESRIDYIFEDGDWSPENPIGQSTATDNIRIADGSVDITGVLVANNIEVATGATLNINSSGILDLAGDITNNGALVFQSDAAGSGQLADFSGSISGDVTVERFIPAGDANNRAFRLLTSTVDAGSIYDNWQEGGSSPEGFGTHITGSETGANGFDATGTGNPSLYSFDNSVADQSGGAAWTAATNTDATNLEAGVPYRLYVRGDRTIDLTEADPTPTNTVLRATGSLKTGTVPAVDLAQESAQFSFIGNPYQAIVNLNDVNVLGDVNMNFLYAWDANANDNGAFVTVELPEGTNPSANPNVSNYLQPGQAVFIRNNVDAEFTTPGSLAFTETSKNTSEMQLSPFSDDNFTQVDIRLFTTNDLNNNNLPIDAVGLRFDETFNLGVDDADAGKLDNSGENLAIIQDNKILSIEKRTFPEAEEPVQLFINNFQHTEFIFTAEATNLPDDKSIFIKDNYLETITEIDEDGYEFSIDMNVPESTSIFRFEIQFENETLGVNNYLAKAVKLYPIPVQNELYVTSNLDADLSVEVYNMLGRRVAHSRLAASEEKYISMQHIETGVYIVKLSDGKAVFNQQIIKK